MLALDQITRNLEAIRRDLNQMTSGNVSHKKRSIQSNVEYMLEQLAITNKSIEEIEKAAAKAVVSTVFDLHRKDRLKELVFGRSLFSVTVVSLKLMNKTQAMDHFKLNHSSYYNCEKLYNQAIDCSYIEGRKWLTDFNDILCLNQKKES